MTVSAEHPSRLAIEAIVSRESDIRTIRQLRNTSADEVLGWAALEAQNYPVAAERFEELKALVKQLISEHTSLRTMFANAQAGGLSADELLLLARSLSTHIRTEERQLFERMQQLLSDGELRVLGGKLQSALKDSEESCRLPSATTRLRPVK